MRKIVLCNLFFILQLVGMTHLGAQISKPSAFDSTLYYSLKPIQTSDRTNLEVLLRFKVKSDSSFIISLPEDYYGTRDLHKYVISFQGVKGTAVKQTDNPRQRLISPDKQKNVTIQYTISFNPKIMDGISFGPVVSTSQFHVAGCQWLLPIGNLSYKYKYDIRLTGVPKGWHFYSSLSNNPFKIVVYDSYETLISSALGGGSQAYRKLSIFGKPVYIFVAGKYNISEDKIMDAVNKIVSVQRSWFKDNAFPFYIVTILPRSGIIAGTCIANLFVCFIKPEIELNELNGLVSHEMFHNWLPNKISIKLSEGESDIDYEWLNEGVTDYFSRKILLDAGLLSQSQFVELINRDIINIADNPNRNASLSDLITASKAGKYNTAFKKLSYYRGALMALIWDAQIKKAGNGKHLKDLILQLFDVAQKSNGQLSKEQFYSITSRFGLNVKKDIDQYITQGLHIELPSDAFGNAYHLREKNIPSFNPGFSLEQSVQTKKIQNVIENGPAFEAGLRNGMEFTSMQNSFRFINGWSPQKPITITVKLENGKKNIAFFPHGKVMKLMLYSPVN